METKIPQSKIYFWNLMGNLVFAGSSAVFMMIVSRFTDARTADVFSLAYGIAAIFVVIGLFQVRTYQGTDVLFKHSFSSYALARLLTILLMLAALFPYLLFSNFDLSDWSRISIVVLYVLFRMCEAIADLFHGLFQQHERLDIAGKSMTIRYSLSIVILLGLLLLTGSLEWSLLLLFLFNFVFVWFYDFPKSLPFARASLGFSAIKAHLREALQILTNCFPLFISGFLLAYIFNEPRLAIDEAINLGRLAEGLQRNYNILFMPVFFMSLFILILRPLTTSLAQNWQKQEYSKFDATLKRLTAYLVFGGAGLTFLAFLIGIPILSLVFGVDLSADRTVLTLLVLSGILYSMGIVLGDILTIFRKQQNLLLLYVLMFILSKLITRPLVMAQGLLGAAISFLIVMLLYTLGSLVTYVLARRRKGLS